MTLIERLERAERGSRELDFEIWRTVSPPTEYFGSKIERISYSSGNVVIDTADGFRHFDTHDIPLFTQSLDAALTLVPKGWYVDQIGEWCSPALRETGPWLAIILNKIGSRPSVYRCNHAATPALALCIAALKARSTP